MAVGIIVRDTTTGTEAFIPISTSGTILTVDPSKPYGLLFTSGQGGSAVAAEQTWSVHNMNGRNSFGSGRVLLEIFNGSGSGKTIKVLNAKVSVVSVVASGNIFSELAMIRTGSLYIGGVAEDVIPMDISNTLIPANISFQSQSSGASNSGIIATAGIGNKNESVQNDPVAMEYNLYKYNPGGYESPLIIRERQGIVIRVLQATITPSNSAPTLDIDLTFTVA